MASRQGTKAYGSGYFGEWVTDEFGLPAYRYDCDQTSDPKAVSPVTKEIRSPTDHIHQVGNDRLVAVASNYGYVQVRQDEGAPKFLNDHAPELGQYGGGIGYITDGMEFSPKLPLEEYRFRSPLLGFLKSSGGYEGWYDPSAPGEWLTRVTLPAAEAKEIHRAEVNGKKQVLGGRPGGVFELKGESALGKPLRWSLGKG